MVMDLMTIISFVILISYKVLSCFGFACENGINRIYYYMLETYNNILIFSSRKNFVVFNFILFI